MDMSSAEKAADLLQVDRMELKRTLSERVIAARGEIMQKLHTLTEAEYGLNALAKVCALFSLRHRVLQRAIIEYLASLLNLCRDGRLNESLFAGHLRPTVHVDCE